MKSLEIPFFAKRKDLFNFLVENKSTLIAQKKACVKNYVRDGMHFDGVPFNGVLFDDKDKAMKANAPVSLDILALKVKAIINTTNIIDSYLDMHVPKIWNRSLKENAKNMLHMQEHKMGFADIIADGKDLKAYVQTYTWKELGLNYAGTTEGLTFESIVRKDRNKFMHEQYAMGRVKNHSVGMRYIQLVMCINDKDYGAEFEAYEKYIKMAVNPDVAEETGYFWAVTEAQCIEGSAVVLGANTATPTLDNNMEGEKDAPDTTKKGIDYAYLAQNLKLAR